MSKAVKRNKRARDHCPKAPVIEVAWFETRRRWHVQCSWPDHREYRLTKRVAVADAIARAKRIVATIPHERVVVRIYNKLGTRVTMHIYKGRRA